jgi:hypothetical protein
MSASITWEAVKPKKTLSISAPQSFITIMEELMDHSYPWSVHEAYLDLLRGAAAGSGPGVKEGFLELIEIVKRFETVIVGVEY